MVNFIKDSLTKEEITDYFSGAEPGAEKPGGGISVEEKVKSNKRAFGIAAVIIVVLLGLAIGYYFVGGMVGGGSKDVTRYENEKLGFQLDYPSGWYIQAHPFRENIFMIVENSEGGIKSLGQIYVGQKENSIEETKSSFENQIGGNENISFLDNVKYIENGEGLDFTARFKNPQGNFIARYRVIWEGNVTYWVVLNVLENDYPSYEEKFSHVFESFTLI